MHTRRMIDYNRTCSSRLGGAQLITLVDVVSFGRPIREGNKESEIHAAHQQRERD